MANLKLSTTVRNQMLDIITARASANAVLKIFSGTQPAGGGAETTVLAELTCNATFAPAATAGTLTLNSVTGDTSANNTGTATWFRVETAGGTWVMDGDVSTISAGTGDLQLDDVTITAGATVSLGGPNTITAPNAA